MKITKIALFMLLCAPQWGFANCDNVKVESLQPINFSLIRLLPNVTSGHLSLWPDGRFNMSKGLSLSNGSSPHPGKIKITAPSGITMRFSAHIEPDSSVKFKSKIDINGIRIKAPRELIYLHNNEYLIKFPNSRNLKPVSLTFQSALTW